MSSPGRDALRPCPRFQSCPVGAARSVRFRSFQTFQWCKDPWQRAIKRSSHLDENGSSAPAGLPRYLIPACRKFRDPKSESFSIFSLFAARSSRAYDSGPSLHRLFSLPHELRQGRGRARRFSARFLACHPDDFTHTGHEKVFETCLVCSKKRNC